MNADKVIEWFDHVMGVKLSPSQKDMIRMEFGEGTAFQDAPDKWAEGGHRFSSMVRRAYREAEEEYQVQMDLARQMMVHCVLCASGEHEPDTHEKPFWSLMPQAKGRPAGEAIMDSDDENLMEHKYGEDFLAEVAARQADEKSQKMESMISEACTNLELMHGHGPAEVIWETDFAASGSRARVAVAYKEDCALCAGKAELKRLTEANDG